MNRMPVRCTAPPRCYELRFRSLFVEGRGYSFTCDERGRVDLDSLSATARTNYFYARTVIGREVSMPAVCALGADPADVSVLRRACERFADMSGMACCEAESFQGGPPHGCER